MRNPTNGQSGHLGPPGEFEYSRRWQDVPVDEVLRPWVFDQAERTSYRKLCAAVNAATGADLVPETVRKFALHRGEPGRTTTRAFAEYYLSRYPRGYVAEKRPPYGTPEPLPPLSDLLPGGHEAARAELEKLVELAKRFPEEVPESTDRLLQWLEKMLAAEYMGEDLSKRPLDSEGNPVK